MDQTKELVRQFGDKTMARILRNGTRLGISIDQEFWDRWDSLTSATSTLINVDDIKAAAAHISQEEMAFVYGWASCIKGFGRIDCGDFAAALDFFGIAESMDGYLQRDDYKKLFARIGSKGLKSRHAPMNRVKDQIIALYRAGAWKSMRNAADKLADKAIELAKTEGAKFSTPDVSDRLYEWIRESKK